MNFVKKTGFFFAVVILSAFLVQPAYAADYSVVRGDSLFMVGKLFNTDAATLKTTNGLQSDTIYPGQVLDVPSAVHTVGSGDSLFLIAKRYGISLYSLRYANNKWNDSIYPGQKLLIPGVSSNNAALPSTSIKPAIPYTTADLDLMARLITAEAGSEPYNAQVAVGAVVVNRVQSGKFAGTIRSVIYERINGYYQFTPVENGWINRPATQDAKNAAYAALHGSDPSRGALFYFDESATNKWLWSKPLAARIGKMVFVY